jgi:DNA invertase Pin-like site-specific DNA recombinase
MVTRLDRLARSTRDLLNILHTVGERSIGSNRSLMLGRISRRRADCWSLCSLALLSSSAN